MSERIVYLVTEEWYDSTTIHAAFELEADANAFADAAFKASASPHLELDVVAFKVYAAGEPPPPFTSVRHRMPT